MKELKTRKGLTEDAISTYQECGMTPSELLEKYRQAIEVAMELYNLVHESDLIGNKIRANELYQLINQSKEVLK